MKTGPLFWSFRPVRWPQPQQHYRCQTGEKGGWGELFRWWQVGGREERHEGPSGNEVTHALRGHSVFSFWITWQMNMFVFFPKFSVIISQPVCIEMFIVFRLIDFSKRIISEILLLAFTGSLSNSGHWYNNNNNNNKLLILFYYYYERL